jgi:hypothetical protein
VGADAAGGGAKGLLNFLLCCRCCQAPFPIFSFPRFFSLRAILYSTNYSSCTRSSAQETRYGKACENLSEQMPPVPSSLAHPRCSRSHDLDVSGGFLGRWDVASPTTFYPCGCTHPSPDSLCVFRREPEGPEEAPPSRRRRAAQARKFNGPPPPAPRPRRDAASAKRLYLFEHRSRGYHPGLEEAPERNE